MERSRPDMLFDLFSLARERMHGRMYHKQEKRNDREESEFTISCASVEMLVSWDAGTLAEWNNLCALHNDGDARER
jgi:hypothetical protein